MIELKGVGKSYGQFQAVKELNLTIAEGERFVLLGSSGSGKTTTLKMINRLIDCDAGSISIRGKRVETLAPPVLRQGIGYVLQQAALFPHLNILDNISVVPRLLDWSSKRIEERAKHLLGVFGFDFAGLANRRPAQLSGGQQQRIGIIRALMANPPIVLLDEPFSALDPISRVSLRKEFGRLEELKGKTIVLVTHDIKEALELGDRIGLMNGGSLLQTGIASDFLFRPANDYVKSFFENDRYTGILNEMRTSDLIDFLPMNMESASGQDLSLTIDGDTRLTVLLEKLLQTPATQWTLHLKSSGQVISGLTEKKILNAFADWKQKIPV